MASFQASLEALKLALPPETLGELRASTQADLIRYHHGLGTWIRNRWRSGTPLPDELAGLLPTHMDDLSSITLTGLWHHLRGEHPPFPAIVASWRATLHR